MGHFEDTEIHMNAGVDKAPEDSPVFGLLNRLERTLDLNGNAVEELAHKLVGVLNPMSPADSEEAEMVEESKPVSPLVAELTRLIERLHYQQESLRILTQRVEA